MANRIVQGAYIARVDLSSPHLAGVSNKIKAQQEALRALPSRVQLFSLEDGRVVCNGMPIFGVSGGKFRRRLMHYFGFHIAIARHARDLSFLYMRYQGSSPLLILSIKAIKVRNPDIAILVEVPTFPYDDEARSAREKMLHLVDWSCRHRFFSMVDRVVTFSAEEEIFGTRTIRTDNGVATDTQQPWCAEFTGQELRLLGVANLARWHGYDRVMEGMARYYAAGGKSKIIFEIVGAGSELLNLQLLAKQLGIEPFVQFHGPLKGAALDAVAAQCHVGISCIGLHRFKKDTSSLKSREYCARTLPFVDGHSDRDFPPECPYVYKAPADESPLDIGSVLEFRRQLEIIEPNFRDLMREKAENDLCWGKKMQPIIEYLRSRIT